MTNSHGESIGVIVDETTKVGEARRRTSWLAEKLGFDENAQGKAALVVTEAATNLLKHAGGGELIVQGVDDEHQGECLEIFALDSGRGMSDVGTVHGRRLFDRRVARDRLGRDQSPRRLLADLFESRRGHGSLGAHRSKATAKAPATIHARGGRRQTRGAG